MVAPLRRFLILLLLLLQTVAPLVHAHIGEHGRYVRGLHLPVLEAFSNGADETGQTATGDMGEWTQIVELGSAIKLTALDYSPPALLLPDTSLAVFPPSPCLMPVNFSPQPTDLDPPPPFLCTNISRAPPR